MVLAQAGKVTLHTKQYPLDAGARRAPRSRRRPGPRPRDSGPVEEGVPTTCRTRRMARSTTSSTPTCTSGTPAGRTGSRAASSTRRAGSTASTATTSSPRRRPTGTTSSTSRSRPRTSSRTCSTTGYVDKVVFQSTYLYDWYTEGFNTADQNGGSRTARRSTPTRFIVNGRFDPREGDAGLKQLEEDAKKWNLKGVKVYTAEWHETARAAGGWTRPEAYRFLEKCQELGIKNIHAHKGPTIWPLDKDAFGPGDIDRRRPTTRT